MSLAIIAFSLPPRRAEAIKIADLILGRLIFFFIAALTLLDLFWWILIILWGHYGTDTIGQITGLRVSRDRTTSYYALYSYQALNGVRYEEDSIHESVYNQLQSQNIPQLAPVKVRSFLIGPFRYSGLIELNGISARSLLPGTMLCILTTALISLSYEFWIRTAREKYLVQNGTALTGKITDKRSKSQSRSKAYFIKYQYTYPAGTTHTHETKVPGVSRWDTLQIGQSVTVLVDAARPKRTLLYEISKYRIIP